MLCKSLLDTMCKYVPWLMEQTLTSYTTFWDNVPGEVNDTISEQLKNMTLERSMGRGLVF